MGWRAARLDFTNLAHPDWAHSLYPLGYPLLLRLGHELGIDVLRTAFALSIFGGFLGLLGAYWLVRRMTDRWRLAILTELLQARMAFYLFFANLDSTDMLASGLTLCAFPLLLSEKRQRAAAFWGGLLVGLLHNLWFHLRGSSDYIYAWREVPMDIGMLEVIRAQPRVFFTHWRQMFLSYWRTSESYLVDGFLGAFATTSYELYQSADQPPGRGHRAGLYLHWRASAPIAQYLDVFVHVFNADGQLVSQHDSIPAPWTYPGGNYSGGTHLTLE